MSQEESYLCRCSTTSLVDQETMNKNWSFIGSGSEKKSGAVLVKTVHKEYGIILLKGCWWNSKKADVQFSALQVHRPKVGVKAKATENCRYTIQPIWKRLSLFRTITSANQLSLYGAVAEMCEEYETLHERTGQPVEMGQSSSSLVLSVVKTEVPFDSDDPAYQKF